MALTHLVDTSVLTRLGAPSVRSAIEPLAATGRLGRAGISDLEVGYSARNLREWDRFQGALEAFSPVETQARHVKRARQVQRLLAGRSQSGRKIPEFPELAHREVIVPPYRFFYRAEKSTVWIVAVWHGAQVPTPSKHRRRRSGS